LTSADGVQILPSDGVEPAVDPGDSDGAHLWVIVPEEVRVIVENDPPVAPPPLDIGKAKHTNLTGGGQACAGGELWRDSADDSLLYVHGGSGRYPVESPDQLHDVVRVFECLGYRVVSAGWDFDVDRAARTFRR
jgi:hypothetical protein